MNATWNRFCQFDCIFKITTFQSPAVDVVGVGTATGRIIIHNIRLDETLMSFTQDWGPISSLAFRTGTGGNRGVSLRHPEMYSQCLSHHQTVLLLWHLAVLRVTLHSGIWNAARL